MSTSTRKTKRQEIADLKAELTGLRSELDALKASVSAHAFSGSHHGWWNPIAPITPQPVTWGEPQPLKIVYTSGINHSRSHEAMGMCNSPAPGDYSL